MKQDTLSKLYRAILYLLLASLLISIALRVFVYPATSANRGVSVTPSIPSIRVVMDNNYPPYVFLDENGNARGILVDQWALWEKRTGVKVELSSIPWGDALSGMQAGKFDVIDTIFYTDERAQLYHFTNAYARIDVPIFFRNNISGIADVGDLKGFSVAVKSGDADAEYLEKAGVVGLVYYDSYEGIIQAAQRGEVNIFVIDQPPGLYFLYKYGLQNQFNYSAPLFSGEFHRAVKKGDAALLALVVDGFAGISPSEYQAVDNRWFGIQQNSAWQKYLPYLGLGVAIVGVIIFILIVFTRILQKRVSQRTQELNQALLSLRKSERRYREIFNATTEAIFIHAVDGQLLHVNESMLRMYGYASEEEALSKNISDFSADEPPYTLADAREKIRKALEEGPQVFEWRAKKKTGELFWVEIALRSSQIGGKGQILAVMRDINERKRTAEIIEKRIVALTQPLEGGTFTFEELFNIDEIQRVQDAFAQATGVASIITQTDGIPITAPSNFTDLCSQVIRKTQKGCANCIKSDAEIGRYHQDGPIVQPCLSGGLWDAGAAITVGGQHIANWLIGQVRDKFQTEEKMRAYAHEIGANEEIFMKAFRAVPSMSRKQFDQIAQALFILANQLSTSAYQNIQQARFITERKLAEQALKDSESRFRLLAENSTDMISRHNIQGAYLYASPACRTLLGYEPEELIGRSAFEFVHPDDIPVVDQTLSNTTFQPVLSTTIFRARRKNGQYTWLETTSHAITDPETGAVLEIHAVSRDVTERKQAEDEIYKLNAELEQRVRERTVQLETTNKELEAFSYSVSHDLRAPLRGIDGWSMALLEDYGSQLDDQANEYLRRVRSETQRMGRLIDDLLQLARLTRAEISVEQVNLSDIAQAIAARLQNFEPQRRVDFDIQADLTISGDPRLLEVVLSNLLGNAFKFTGKMPQAHIEFGQTTLQGERVFFVRDNGAGFDMAYAKNLFGAFQRMHKVTEFPGTGIGLATVQRIIHRHGGRIWAEADVNRGATFYFTLG